MWVREFNPNNPKRMQIPKWITLQKLPTKFISGAENCFWVGYLFQVSPKNSMHAGEQHFWVALEGGEGWEMSLVMENETMGKAMAILINYYYLSIYCKFCQEWDDEAMAMFSTHIVPTLPLGDLLHWCKLEIRHLDMPHCDESTLHDTRYNNPSNQT